MPDLGRFLPLSNRPGSDESAVSRDRRNQIADVVAAAARIVAAAPPEQAAALAGEFVSTARLREEVSPDAAGLALLDARVREGRRRGIRTLSRVVRAYLLLTQSAGVTAQLPPAVTGAVALYAATTAPLPRRAVVAGHRVRASDDGWEFGRGTRLEGTGVQIIAFLLAVSEEPPRPPAPSPE